MNTNTPHRLSVEAIQEFQEIYREEFGKMLTKDEAEEMGMRLLMFFSILKVPELEK
jgi:hypothetical protein